MPDKPDRPKRRLWRRVLRKLLLTALFVAAVAALALSGGIWWVHAHRLELANRALGSLPGPVSGSVEGIEVRRSGDIELRGLTLKDRASGASVLRLPRVTGRLDWGALPSRTVPQLTLHEPEISLDEPTLARWFQPAPGAGNAEAPVTAPAPAFRLEKFSIHDAKVRITRRDNICTELLLNYHADFIALGRDGRFSMGDEELTIARIGVSAEGQGLPFGLHRLHAKGRMHDGVLDLDELTCEGPSVHFTPELFATLGMPAAGGAAGAGGTGASIPVASTPAAPVLQGIRVGRLVISDFAFSASGFSTGNASGLLLPESKVLVSSYEAAGFEWRHDGRTRVASQTLHLQDLSLDAGKSEGHFHCGEWQIVLAPWEPGKPFTVQSLYLRNPDVHWTPALRRLLVQEAAGSPAPAVPVVTPPAPATASAPWSLAIASAAITGARVRISDAAMMPFDLQAGGGFLLASLTLDEQGWHSQSFQSLELTDARLAFADPSDGSLRRPFFEATQGELVMKPDDWNRSTRVARLALQKPVVRLRDGNTPWVAAGTAGAAAAAEKPSAEEKTASASPAISGPPWWQRLHFGQLAFKDGFVDLLMDAPKPVDMQAHVGITTRRMDDGGSLHRVRIEDLSARLPTLSPLPFPVVQAGVLEGAVRLPEMWRQHRLEELHLSGASVDFGEALLKLFEPDKAAPVPPPVAKTEQIVLSGPVDSRSKAPWRVGHLSIRESAMTINNLVPGLPSVKFGVSFEVKDTPLLVEDLVDDIAPQRIELHDLKIPSPNGTARYVAELDSIFVNFSLEGLMRKEIEGIEIVSPTLFVGEDLFWYVDFYRKFAERGAQPAPHGPQIAANDDKLEFELAGAVAEAEPPISQASWSVKRLQVHSGKLLLAPKGTPLKGFKEPFPFHIDTEVKRGTLNAAMEVPPDTYELPDLNLQFVGMKGAVQFNLPLKQKDNNLVETFEVDSIRWKELKTGKAFLSVTYDALGIYAKFGAEAYEGYINGEVNVYLDDSFHWDGWLGGKNVQTHELTRKLCPLYFLMDGRVEATLVAQGSKDELYQADGSFKNHTPGRFSISALNGLINDLPHDWDPLKAQLSKIGLETLRDFDYDHAEMNCRFYGREGNGLFKFAGPNGSRNFDINVYDHRWKTDDEIRMTKSE